MYLIMKSVQFSSVSQSCLTLCDPWTAAHQASLSITNSRSLPKLMSIGSVMPSNHLIPCRPLLLPPSIFPSIRVFSNESLLCIRWPKYWSFSFCLILIPTKSEVFCSAECSLHNKVNVAPENIHANIFISKITQLT